MTSTTASTSRTRRFVFGSSLALCAALFTPAAWAHGPEISIHFSVPLRIPAPRLVEVQPYLLGHVYFAPHHHDHVIYSFPVETRYGVEYVPYTYCEGVRIRTGYVPGYDPRFDDAAAGYGRVEFDGPAYRTHGWHDRMYGWHGRGERFHRHRGHEYRERD